LSKKLIPDAKSINFQSDDIGVLSDVEKSIALESGRLRVEGRTGGSLNCYLVGVEAPDSEQSELKESLSELGALVRTLGDEVTGVTVQKRARITPATYIGSGKAEELAQRCRELKVDYVAFDVELSPTHVRNLERIIERPVLDRTEVILQIFRKNAKTKEAQTQVEIARLEYLLPRISNAWIAFERQRGGSGGSARVRGAGEAQLELDKRRMRDKITALRRELEKISTEKLTQRKARRSEFSVVLVGYTNAGKTTLMNALTDSQLSAKDALFETLDSSVRTLKGTHKPKILLTDTVGFIRHLPHALIASFQSTLNETAEADLLVHVVDISHRNYKDHIRITDDVLREVGAADVPRLFVFNKLDQLEGEPRLERILSRTYPGCICMSANRPEDVNRLLEAIEGFFLRNMLEVTIDVPYPQGGGASRRGDGLSSNHTLSHGTDARSMGLIYSHARVLDTDWQDDLVRFRVRATRDFLSKHFPQVLDPGSAGLQDSSKHSKDDEAILDPWSSAPYGDTMKSREHADASLETTWTKGDDDDRK
jgi:GTP-binding protein HflX